MKKKKLSFRVFFDKFISHNTKYKIKQSINQIFYGSLTCDKISQSSAAKMRDAEYEFSSGTRIFKDYIISNEFSMEKKSHFIKNLNLSNLPKTGAELCDKLSDYYLSDEISEKLRKEGDIYIALVMLLEHIIYAKDLEEPEKSNVNNNNCTNASWNAKLMDAIYHKNRNIPLNSFKEPLGWYIHMISNHTKLNSGEIAKKSHLARATFSRKTNPNAKRKRHLYLADIQEICNALGTSLGSILYCFENKETFETNPQLIDSLCFLRITRDEVIAPKKETMMKKLLKNPEESVFKKWFGKYYCYFSSTNSKETFSGKKEFAGKHCSDDKYRELAELFTDDHIYCGILVIAPLEDSNNPRCAATFSFMVNPEHSAIKEYEGTVTISKDKQATFIQLYGNEEAEMSFLIIEDTKGNNKVRCAMASVLTISSRENHRKPCSERMIISEQRIYPNTRSYQVMKANLKMHDKYIRIDSFGFDEVIKELKSSGNQEYIDIAEKYDKLEKIGALNAVDRKELAYIKDTHISNLTNLTEEQKVIFESSLRFHSIAPWYAKVNSKIARDLIEIIREDNANN